MKKLHIYLMAYQRVIPLRITIDCFLIQTYPYWKMTIVHDGPAPDEVRKIVEAYSHESRISFIETPQRNGEYGFPNRRMCVEQADPADGEYLLFCADDSYYVLRFVEYMMLSAANDVGMVYCDMVHSHIAHDLLKAELKVNHIDMGAFVTHIGLAKAVGFRHSSYAADGLFAEECAAKAPEMGLRTVYIPKPLFYHN